MNRTAQQALVSNPAGWFAPVVDSSFTSPRWLPTVRRSVKNIMQHQIREARSEDVDAIARLIDVLGYELDPTLISGRLEAYSDSSSKVFIAAADAEVIGFLSFHAIPLFHEAAMLGRITAIAIDPDHQREGIGSSLVSAAENFGISIGCSRMEVTSGDRREHDAHRFYSALGYYSDCRRFLKPLPNTEQDGGQRPD